MKFKHALLVLLVFLFGWCSQARAQAQETRVALVIGNSNYKNAPQEPPQSPTERFSNEVSG